MSYADWARHLAEKRPRLAGASVGAVVAIVVVCVGASLTAPRWMPRLLAPANPYESASDETTAGWKRIRVPLPSGTRFVVSQGAFGRDTHNQRGIELRWDFDVPYGTPVLAVEDGTIFAVNEPHRGGGCDPKYSEVPSSVLLKLADGTVAQYTHIESRASVGQAVKAGDVVAVTALNGFICTPQLDFLVFRSDRTLYDSPQRESIPLRFEGLPRELASKGASAVVP